MKFKKNTFVNQLIKKRPNSINFLTLGTSNAWESHLQIMSILDIQGLQSPTSRTGLSSPLDLAVAILLPVIIPAIEHTPPAQIITNYYL
jgi:hypothetical protein